MSKRHQNETIEQQKRARREFLELKKMQSGEMNPGPKPSEEAVILKTPMQKLGNLWYHFKGPILIAAFFIMAFIVLVAQCAGRTNYDLEVIYYTSNSISETQVDAIADYVEQFGDDINDNGKVDIQVINCSYADENLLSNYNRSITTKLQSILTGDSKAVLFITDEKTYEKLRSLSGGDDVFSESPVLFGENFYNSVRDDDVIYRVPDGLQISCRNVSDSKIEKDKNVKKVYEESKKILEKIAEDNSSSSK